MCDKRLHKENSIVLTFVPRSYNNTMLFVVFQTLFTVVKPSLLADLFCFFKMTGLDIEKDQIIEMACIITDSDLNILAEVI